MALLDDYHDFDFKLEATGEIFPDGNKWYYNILVRYFSLSIDNANLPFNGTVTTKATEFSALGRKIHYLAVRLTSKPFQGKKMVWVASAAAISAGFKNNLGRAGFLALSFSGKTITPLDAAGNQVSPCGISSLMLPFQRGNKII